MIRIINYNYSINFMTSMVALSIYFEGFEVMFRNASMMLGSINNIRCCVPHS
jgi:hypothetical protein